MNKNVILAISIVIVMILQSGYPAVHATSTAADGTTSPAICSVSQPLGLAFDPANNNIYVADSGSNSVSVISGTSNTIIATIPVGVNPNQVAYDPFNQEIYVSNSGSTTVSAISSTTDSVVATISVDPNSPSSGQYGPYWLAFNPTNNQMYVTNYNFPSSSNTVAAIDSTTNTVVSTITVGQNPIRLTYDPSNRDMYVADYSSGQVSVISSSNSVISTVGVPGNPDFVGYDAANGDVYVASNNSNKVTVISSASNSVVATVSIGGNPYGATYDPVNTEMYVSATVGNSVYAIDSNTNTIAATIPANNPSLPGPYSVTFDPANGYMYASNTNDNSFSSSTVTVISSSNAVIANLPVGAQPDQSVYNPTSRNLYVVNHNSDSVSVISPIDTIAATITSGSCSSNIPFFSVRGPMGLPVGFAGDQMTVVGFGWTPGSTVTIGIPLFFGSLGTPLVHDNGAFIFSVPGGVPDLGLAPGLYRVLASSSDNQRGIALLPCNTVAFPIVDLGACDFLYLGNTQTKNLYVSWAQCMSGVLSLPAGLVVSGVWLIYQYYTDPTDLASRLGVDTSTLLSTVIGLLALMSHTTFAAGFGFALGCAGFFISLASVQLHHLDLSVETSNGIIGTLGQGNYVNMVNQSWASGNNFNDTQLIVMPFVPNFRIVIDAARATNDTESYSLAIGFGSSTENRTISLQGTVQRGQKLVYNVSTVNSTILATLEEIQISKFFTDANLNPLPKDSSGNPKTDVVLSNGKVRSTNPGQILGWVNMTNTGVISLQSLILNDSVPSDWTIHPSWLPAKGAISVFFELSSGTLVDITNSTTISTTSGNPETISLSISNITSTLAGQPLAPGESILLSVKLGYTLVGTSQTFNSYPRNYTDTTSASAWMRPSFNGGQASASGSAFFVAYAKVNGDVDGDGVVNLQDASMIAYAFGARPGDARWNPALDVFGEGVIDLQDVSYVYLNYGNHA